MLIVDLSLARVVQHSSFQFYALPTLELSLISMVQCGHMCMRMTTSTLRIQNLINSLLTEMITPQTYNYIYTYKTVSCLPCIRGSLRLAPNQFFCCFFSRYSYTALVSHKIRADSPYSNCDQSCKGHHIHMLAHSSTRHVARGQKTLQNTWLLYRTYGKISKCHNFSSKI